MPPLVHQLAIATVLVSATVVVHLVGLDVLQLMLRWHLRRLTKWVTIDRAVVPVGLVLGLFVVHGAEIWLYALAFWASGAVHDLPHALYVSISGYASLGETGSSLPETWHVAGALEAINGLLLIGWSTAFLFEILRHLMWDDETAVHLPRGAIARRKARGRGNR